MSDETISGTESVSATQLRLFIERIETLEEEKKGIADDIKDEVAPTSITGKREGGDRLSGKLTYPALFGVEGSRGLLQREFDAAVAALGPFSRDTALLLQVAADAVAPATRGRGA